MSLGSFFRQVAIDRLAHRGLEVRRHSAARRQAMLARHQVDLVLDVGAATGAYGRELREFGYQGRIVSFEPLPAAYRKLSEGLAADPYWSAHNVALGSERGSKTINVASNSDSSSLLPMLGTHLEAAPSIRYVAEETVEVDRLDEVGGGMVQAAHHPYLKIDTQGFERQVLSGAEHTVKRCVGLQLELSFVELYEGSMIADEAISWAYEQGFHLVGIEQGYSAPTGEILQTDGVFFRDALVRDLPPRP